LILFRVGLVEAGLRRLYKAVMRLWLSIMLLYIAYYPGSVAMPG